MGQRKQDLAQLVGILILTALVSGGAFYLEEVQRKYWTGFQEGYAAAVGVPVVARDEAAELRDRVAELERTNFELSEDSAIVANENAELRAALGAATEAIGSVLADPFYIISGPARNALEEALRAALAATEGSER